MNSETKYRGFTIKPLEIPYRDMKYEFLHPAYNGPMDHIHAGTGGSIEDCKREIDDRILMWEENWGVSWMD